MTSRLLSKPRPLAELLLSLEVPRVITLSERVPLCTTLLPPFTSTSFCFNHIQFIHFLFLCLFSRNTFLSNNSGLKFYLKLTYSSNIYIYIINIYNL